MRHCKLRKLLRDAVCVLEATVSNMCSAVEECAACAGEGRTSSGVIFGMKGMRDLTDSGQSPRYIGSAKVPSQNSTMRSAAACKACPEHI